MDKLQEHVDHIASEFSKEYPAKRLYFNQLMTSPMITDDVERSERRRENTLMSHLLYSTAQLTDTIQEKQRAIGPDNLYWFYGGSFAWFLQFGQYAHALERGEIEADIPNYQRNLISGSILPQNLDMWIIAPQTQQETIWNEITTWAKSLETTLNTMLREYDQFDWETSTRVTPDQLLSTIADEINTIHERSNDKWRIQTGQYTYRRGKTIKQTQPSDLKVRLEIFDKQPQCTLFNRCKSLLMYLENNRDSSIQKQLLYLEFPIDIAPITPDNTLLPTIQQLDNHFVTTYGDPATKNVIVRIQGKPYELNSIRTMYPLKQLNEHPLVRQHLPYGQSDHAFPVLNIFGLSLFKQFIVQQRSDKDYDIDLYRRRLVSYTISGNNTVNDKLDEQLQLALLLTYSRTFQDSPHKNEFVLQNYFQKIVDNQTADFRETFYAKCRGRINELMKQFQPWMKAQVPILETRSTGTTRKQTASKARQTRKTRQPTKTASQIDTMLFEVGGNVMRRYLEEIRSTNDIDYKIYYEQRHRSIFREKMFLWSSLVCHSLQTTMWQQFFWDAFDKSPFIQTITQKYSYGPIGEYGYTAEFSMFDVTGQNMSFRSRYIEKNENFPIDLFSVDYQTGVNVMIYHISPSGRKTILERLFIPFLIPILDWSCADKTSADYRRLTDTVGAEINQDTLVPSKRWLLQDFQNTYTTPDLYRMRIGAGKMEKDMKRINLLQQSMGSAYYDDTLDVVYSKQQRELWVKFMESLYHSLLSPEFIEQIQTSQTVSLVSYHTYQQSMLNGLMSCFMLSDLLMMIEQSPIKTLNPVQQKLNALRNIGYFPENVLVYLPYTTPIVYATLFMIVYRMDKHVGNYGNHKMKFSYSKINEPEIVSKMIKSSKTVSKEDMKMINRFYRLQQEYLRFLQDKLPETNIVRRHIELLHTLPDMKTTDHDAYTNAIQRSLRGRSVRFSTFQEKLYENYRQIREKSKRPSQSVKPSRKRTRKTIKIRKESSPVSKRRRKLTVRRPVS